MTAQKTPQQVITEHQQRSDPHDNHCICGFGDEPGELGLSWAEHLWVKLREEAGVLLRREADQVRAEALRDAAESLPPLLTQGRVWREGDDSGITAADLLREYADNYENPGLIDVKGVVRALVGEGMDLNHPDLPIKLWERGLRWINQGGTRE